MASGLTSTVIGTLNSAQLGAISTKDIGTVTSDQLNAVGTSLTHRNRSVR